MVDYIGKKCPVCNKTFTDKDDIVVCPVCGTPYHRECYKKVGTCINTTLHEQGITWEEQEEKNNHIDAIKQNYVICPNCGTRNDSSSLFCNHCGIPLKNNINNPYTIPNYNNHNETNNNDSKNGADSGFNQNMYGNIDIQPFLINFSDPLCGYNPDDELDGVKISELGAFVDSNTHYYLPLFKRIKMTGRRLSLNFTAMLFPELYFANRKMPLYAIIFYLLRIIIAIPTYIQLFSVNDFGALSALAGQFDVKSASFQMLVTISTILNYAVMFLGGGFANYIYYKHCLRKISSMKSSKESVSLDELRQKGGTSTLLLIIFVILMILPFSVLYLFFVVNAIK